jgi:hypothetical protein
MDNSVHYLHFAYIAEISIVFNLAFVELKWKGLIKEVRDKMAPGVALVPSVVGRLICKKRKCDKCFHSESLAKKFRKYKEDYLIETANALYADLDDNKKDHPPDKKSLLEAWSLAIHSPLKYLYWAFHVMVVRAHYYRVLSLIFLALTTLILLLQTMADAGLDFPMVNFLDIIGMQRYSSIWVTTLFCLLLVFTLSPFIFWLLWHAFLHQYECLNISLSQAYQSKTKSDFDKALVEMVKIITPPPPEIAK